MKIYLTIAIISSLLLGNIITLKGQSYSVNHSTLSTGGSFKKDGSNMVNSTVGEPFISKPDNRFKAVSAGFQALHTYLIVTSTIDSDSQIDVHIFPNPFRNEIFITSDKKFSSIRIVDLRGNVVINVNPVSYPISNLDQLVPGYYILIGRLENKEYNLGKLIKI